MMLFVSRSGPSRSSPLPDPPLKVTVKCGEMPSFASNRCNSRPDVMLPAKSRMLSPAAMPTYGVSSESRLVRQLQKDIFFVDIDIHDLGLRTVIQLNVERAQPDGRRN